jgi:hypothetical protein
MSASPNPSTSGKSDTGSKAVVIKRSKDGSQIQLSRENQTIKVIKKPKIVLEEDDFTGELEKIIVRDYFPELPKLKVSFFMGYFIIKFQAQQAYMDAVANNDVEKIRELQLRYSSDFTNQTDTKTVRRVNLNGGRFDVDTEMEEVLVNPEGLNEEVGSLTHILFIFLRMI